MTEQDDFIPPWLDQKPQELTPGTYVWSVSVSTAKFQDQEREKPYVKIDLDIMGGPFTGYKFPFRLYLTKAARGWAMYFLRKFEYPTELIECAQPVIRASAIVGLTGKVWVEVADSELGLQFNVKGFERNNETELEDKLTPKQEIVLESTEPIVDLEADIKKKDDLSWLD
jgi:hypothetical protein